MDCIGGQQSIRREFDPSICEDSNASFVKDSVAVYIAVNNGVVVLSLEKEGIPRDAYQLGREFDPEALARSLESADSAIEVRLEVQGVSLAVTNRGVWVTDDPPSSPPECP